MKSKQAAQDDLFVLKDLSSSVSLRFSRRENHCQGVSGNLELGKLEQMKTVVLQLFKISQQLQATTISYKDSANFSLDKFEHALQVPFNDTPAFGSAITVT